MPFIDYKIQKATSGARMRLLDLNEALARLIVAKNFYRGFSQIKWRNEFIDRETFQQELEKIEEELFRAQLIELGINKEEHSGKPSNFEVISLFDEINLLKKLLFELEALIYERDLLYLEITTEVQENLQKKLQLREISSAIPENIKAIESRVHILKVKIDRILPWAFVDSKLLATMELLKTQYNEFLLLIGLEKIDRLRSQVPSGLFKFFSKTQIVISKPLIPQAIDSLYLEFELNIPSEKNLNAKDRISNFESTLKQLKGPTYSSIEINFQPQNGFQEAAYYYARVRHAPVIQALYKIQNRDDLREFQELVLAYQEKEIELPQYFRSVHAIGRELNFCARYFL